MFLTAKVETDLIFVWLSELPKIFVCIFPAFKRVISHEIFLDLVMVTSSL